MIRSDDKLVVRLTTWNRIREIVEFAGMLAGLLYLFYAKIEEFSFSDLVPGLIIAAMVSGLFILSHPFALSRRPLLVVDAAGVDVGYPLALGLSRWSAIEYIGTRRKFRTTMLCIRSLDLEAQIARKPLWTRLTYRMYTDRPKGGLKGVTVYLPENHLPVSARDFIEAMKAFQPQGSAGEEGEAP